MKMHRWFEDIVNISEQPFCGTVFIGSSVNEVFEQGYGFANHSEQIKNTPRTRFGIASSSKIFTSVAICQLVEKRLLSFDTLLTDCLKFSFPNFDTGIIVHHLLSHSSGLPDYFDEETMTDYGDLWRTQPMMALRHQSIFCLCFKIII